MLFRSGLRAHAAFTAMVSGVRLECRPRPGDTVPPLVDCLSGMRPVARTLVAQGWAEANPASADPKTIQAEAKARAEAVGLWSKAPPEPGPSAR